MLQASVVQALPSSTVFTVIESEFEVAGLPVKHPALAVITHVIASLLTNVEFVYVALFNPSLIPFFFHWKEGDAPPFVGEAVNVTLVPAQIVVPGLAAIITLDVAGGFIETLIALEILTH